LKDITRLIRENFRYPEQWYGDYISQLGALWTGEREMVRLAEAYGAETLLLFQEEYLDYGDRLMTEEIRKLPKGTWKGQLLWEKIEPIAPEGITLEVELTIDPQAAVITYDLSGMPDQLPWGYNLSESCARGACIEGTMPCLSSDLPRNQGVYRHINIILREGSVAGIPRWPVGTSIATSNLADATANIVGSLWEQVEAGRGHADSGYINPITSWASGTDWRKDNTPYGHTFNIGVSGGGGVMGHDGWPGFFCMAIQGNMRTELVELTEVKVPVLIAEVSPEVDSGGAGQWRGAVGMRVSIQPRLHTMKVVTYCTGLTCAPRGVQGGHDGALSRHWVEPADGIGEVRVRGNVGIFEIHDREVWVGHANGGGGYGRPLDRDPAAVLDDVVNGFVSLKASQEEYGVVLAPEGPSWRVDEVATERLRRGMGDP
jgi:N-methylhydantoinase B